MRALTPENKTNEQTENAREDAREEARSLAELDRVVGFQAKELRYLRVTLAEKERALAAATGRVRKTETDTTKPKTTTRPARRRMTSTRPNAIGAFPWT